MGWYKSIEDSADSNIPPNSSVAGGEGGAQIVERRKQGSTC